MVQRGPTQKHFQENARCLKGSTGVDRTMRSGDTGTSPRSPPPISHRKICAVRAVLPYTVQTSAVEYMFRQRCTGGNVISDGSNLSSNTTQVVAQRQDPSAQTNRRFRQRSRKGMVVQAGLHRQRRQASQVRSAVRAHSRQHSADSTVQSAA